MFLALVNSLIAYEHSFVIVIASYNNATWYQKNLDSVFNQTYQKYRIIYTDDCSTDGTGSLVQAYIHKRGMRSRVRYKGNTARCGHLCNQYEAIHSCRNNEIVVILDGDDWFAHDHVLKDLNALYANFDVWLTYGQFKEFSTGKIGYCKPIPHDVLMAGTIRSYRPWILGHARTFYAGLFKRIRLDDLLYNGRFFPMAADVATMIPMVEMAREKVCFVPDVLYIHNDCNPLNFKKVWRMQAFYELIIRRKSCYDPLAQFCID
jgi:glycosyltransferase involved in cell wall biosynthesis